jgi:hypothetical protein
MDVTSRTHAEQNERIQNVGRPLKGKDDLWHMGVVGKIDLKRVLVRDSGWERIDWTELAYNKGLVRAFVITVMSLRGPQKQGISWSAKYQLLC